MSDYGDVGDVGDVVGVIGLALTGVGAMFIIGDLLQRSGPIVSGIILLVVGGAMLWWGWRDVA